MSALHDFIKEFDPNKFGEIHAYGLNSIALRTTENKIILASKENYKVPFLSLLLSKNHIPFRILESQKCWDFIQMPIFEKAYFTFKEKKEIEEIHSTYFGKEYKSFVPKISTETKEIEDSINESISLVSRIYKGKFTIDITISDFLEYKGTLLLIDPIVEV